MSTPPDFHELVGDEGTPEELAKLRRAHDLLIAAGPPPELSPRLAEPPQTRDRERFGWWHARRNQIAFGLAAAVAAAAFGVGYLVGTGPDNFSASRSLEMHGVGQLASARATLAVGDQDPAGNYPLKMTVRGLPRTPDGGWYELLLSKNGRPTLPCGSFAVSGRSVTVRLSVPYDLSKFPTLFDGWVVTRHAPKESHVPVVLTT
ncbi:MAG TPA: hypothetical protein VFA24_05875 [Gaiellaceae bacterium]|nr:hypothetical protein [Gaiellaceae bacterium]